MPIEWKRVAADVRSHVERGRQRAPSDYGRIEKRRQIARNAEVLAGTRIPTAAVWSLHKADYSVAAIIREYPRLHAGRRGGRDCLRGRSASVEGKRELAPFSSSLMRM